MIIQYFIPLLVGVFIEGAIAADVRKSEATPKGQRVQCSLLMANGGQLDILQDFSPVWYTREMTPYNISYEQSGYKAPTDIVSLNSFVAGAKDFFFATRAIEVIFPKENTPSPYKHNEELRQKTIEKWLLNHIQFG